MICAMHALDFGGGWRHAHIDAVEEGGADATAKRFAQLLPAMKEQRLSLAQALERVGVAPLLADMNQTFAALAAALAAQLPPGGAAPDELVEGHGGAAAPAAWRARHPAYSGAPASAPALRPPAPAAGAGDASHSEWPVTTLYR